MWTRMIVQEENNKAKNIIENRIAAVTLKLILCYRFMVQVSGNQTMLEMLPVLFKEWRLEHFKNISSMANFLQSEQVELWKGYEQEDEWKSYITDLNDFERIYKIFCAEQKIDSGEYLDLKNESRALLMFKCTHY